jgi:hypothetical protein
MRAEHWYQTCEGPGRAQHRQRLLPRTEAPAQQRRRSRGATRASEGERPRGATATKTCNGCRFWELKGPQV